MIEVTKQDVNEAKDALISMDYSDKELVAKFQLYAKSFLYTEEQRELLDILHRLEELILKEIEQSPRIEVAIPLKALMVPLKDSIFTCQELFTNLAVDDRGIYSVEHLFDYLTREDVILATLQENRAEQEKALAIKKEWSQPIPWEVCQEHGMLNQFIPFFTPETAIAQNEQND